MGIISQGFLRPNLAILAILLAFTPGVKAQDFNSATFADDFKTNLLQQQFPNLTGVNNLPQNLDTPQGSMAQITNVSELRDVSPNAWAYEALKSLVERYGCIVGYPDRTFRGDRALSRWEFAAGLNACLNTMERLLQENVAVVQGDLDALKRLAQEFQGELTALGTRVDNLETRTAYLEDRQFSTTTKLNGEVILAPANAFGSEMANASQSPLESQFTFGYRARLNFDTSFTGKDRLRTRLQAGNLPNFSQVTGTDMSRLSFDTNTDNDVVVDELQYRFPIGNQVTAWVGARALNLDHIFPVLNPYLESDSTGTLTRFGRRNPLVYRGPEGAGAGIRYAPNRQFHFAALYLADGDTANSPDESRGLFNGSFSTGAQIGFKPFDNWELAATYVHSYQTAERVNLTGSTGSPISNRPFGRVPTTADRFGLQTTWQMTSNINVAGWVGYANATAQGGNRQGDNADLWTWNANVSFVDAFTEGGVFSLGGGMPPRARGVDGGPSDPGTSYILEAQYRYPLSKNITLTPGFFVVLNPNNNNDDSAIWVGTVRTTFKF